MRRKVSFLDVIQLLFQLNFYGKSRRARLARNPDMIRSLVDNAKSRLERIALLVQGNHLHDVGVSDPDGSGVGQ